MNRKSTIFSTDSFRISPTVLIFMVIGLNTVTAQIIFMRQMLSLFQGNELSLGLVFTNWLLWTAAGSWLGGRFVINRLRSGLILASIYLLMVIIIPLIVTIMPAVKLLLDTVGIMLPGLTSIFWISFFILSLFCLLNGALFPVATHFLRTQQNQTIEESIGFVYIWETIGSVVAGLLVSLILIPYLRSFYSAGLLAGINLITAWYLLETKRGLKGKIVTVLIYLSLFVAVISISSLTHNRFQSALWEGYKVLTQERSRYGDLILTEIAENKTIFQNGSPLFTYPDPQMAEEAVHYALLAHAHPQKVLIIGTGFIPLISETAKHRSVDVIDYVSMDRAIIELYAEHIGELPQTTKNVHINYRKVDGRYYLQHTDKKYDVIILDLPDPSTAQMNRFYTVEFFRSAKEHLNPNGLMSFKVQASENYISDVQRRYLQCIYKTLQTVFSSIDYLPGDPLHFFARITTAHDPLTSETLVNRLKTRDLQTRFVREYFIPFRLHRDRLMPIKAIFQADNDAPVNTDSKPVAYYFNIVMWSAQFSEFFRKSTMWLAQINPVMLTVLIMSIMVLMIIPSYCKKSGDRFAERSAWLSTFVMGFTLISLEILIMLSFQSLHGYVYYQLAVFIALFMGGMAFSAWYQMKAYQRLRRTSPEKDTLRLTVIHGFAIMFTLILMVFFVIHHRYPSFSGTWFGVWFFSALSILAGAVGGLHFPLANMFYVYTRPSEKVNAGMLYSVDLMGALAGSFLMSTVFIPVFGYFYAARLIMAMNLLILLVLVLLYHRVKKLSNSGV
ncbi:MAG: hypothetical protein GF313_10775 [Caldithrix sp.]|nr:hypothetical protein [Caldithrix sp.]